MPVPKLTRLTSALHYDPEQGVLFSLLPGGGSDPVAITQPDELLDALRQLRGAQAALLAGYGLALVNRQWVARPSEATRAALIQFAEQERQSRPRNYRLRRLLDEAVARADAAILAGTDVEQALLPFLQQELQRADRAAERCGRIAAELLGSNDRPVLDSFIGGALSWMLAGAQNAELSLTPILLREAGAERALAVAQEQLDEIGLVAQIIDAAALGQAITDGDATIYVTASHRVALDGSADVEAQVAERSRIATASGAPCYVLAPDGPDPEAKDASVLLQRSPSVLPPDMISAIITSRGIYRPSMIDRHLRDGDAPLDIISFG